MEGIVTKFDNNCIICGRPKDCEHHLIPGIATRELCEEDGLKVPMCNRHHNMGSNAESIHGSGTAETLSKIVGQLTWEREWILGQLEDDREYVSSKARREFMLRYGKSYL